MDVVLSYTFWIGAVSSFLAGVCAGAKLSTPAKR
jgi:hypothetical protein